MFLTNVFLEPFCTTGTLQNIQLSNLRSNHLLRQVNNPLNSHTFSIHNATIRSNKMFTSNGFRWEEKKMHALKRISREFVGFQRQNIDDIRFHPFNGIIFINCATIIMCSENPQYCCVDSTNIKLPVCNNGRSATNARNSMLLLSHYTYRLIYIQCFRCACVTSFIVASIG